MVVEQTTLNLLLLNVESVGLTDDQFLRLCGDNPELRLELTAQKELVIMPPAGSDTGWRNSKLNQRLANWAEIDNMGLTFDSSAGFSLRNGAKRSPDAAWVRRERWEALTQEERDGFAPICPDFVVELRSPSDTLDTLRGKMLEYLANGAQLGWLLDPLNKRVFFYLPGGAVEVADDPTTISGGPVLPGFTFDFQEISRTA